MFVFCIIIFSVVTVKNMCDPEHPQSRTNIISTIVAEAFFSSLTINIFTSARVSTSVKELMLMLKG